MRWGLAPGTKVLVDNPMMSSAQFKIESRLTNINQLFWSVQVGLVDGIKTTDVVLGQNVFIYDGRSESLLESELNAFWLDSQHFFVNTDLIVPFAYTVTGRPDGGILEFTYTPSVEAAVIPEPTTLALLSVGFLGLTWLRSKGRGLSGYA